MAGRAVHGHGHLEGMNVHGRAPVVPQVIGLEHVAHAVDHVGLERRLVERRRGKGEHALVEPLFRFQEALGLGLVLRVLEMALHLGLVVSLPAEDVLGIGAAHPFHVAQQDIAPLPRCGQIVAEGEGVGGHLVLLAALKASSSACL